jgi:thymidylate synthase (FAD)
MKVELLQNTNLIICASAIRTCWASHEKSDSENNICGEQDKALIDRVGNKFKHSSTLEHLSYTFYINGISRALLQELARHRIASLSVKSTRYTLKELKEEGSFTKKLNIKKLQKEIYKNEISEKTKEKIYKNKTIKRASKYLVWTDELSVDLNSILALENLRIVLQNGISNDKAKYCLPESYKTQLTWTINARSLQNFINLRSSKSALWEIRILANKIYKNLPNEHKYLFDESLTKI